MDDIVNMLQMKAIEARYWGEDTVVALTLKEADQAAGEIERLRAVAAEQHAWEEMAEFNGLPLKPDSAREAIERLRAKVETLQQFEPVIVGPFNPANVTIRLAQGFMSQLVQSLDAMNGDANYTVTTAKTDGGNEYEVTVRRTDKPTPHELRAEAERKLVDANAELARLRTLYAATRAECEAWRTRHNTSTADPLWPAVTDALDEARIATDAARKENNG